MSHLTNVETAFLNLRSQGYSYDKISEDLRVSKHTLIKWARDLQPKIDTQFRAAFKKYQTALVQRVEFLSQQFQTMTKLITTCDPKSSAYPRYFNILLKLHKSLEPFDVAPEPDSTESAPESFSPRPEHSALSTEHSAQARTESAPPLTSEPETQNQEPARTISAPEPSLEPVSSLSIQNPKSEIQNPERTISAPEPSSGTEHSAPSTVHCVSSPKPSLPNNSVTKTVSSCTESAILSYIEKYRNYFKKDPPEHVFRHLEQAREKLFQPDKDLTRQAS